MNTDPKIEHLIKESERLSENCLYTSTSLLIWLRSKRRIRAFFIVAPLLLGSIAGWKLLTELNLESVRLITSVLAFLAGLLPSIYAALKLDDQIEICANLASEFKNLQDRFRQAALIYPHRSCQEFEAEFDRLVNRLEQARLHSLTPPERFFKAAQKKINSGDYSFNVDASNQIKLPQVNREG
jgi:hypothetical protein